MSRRETSQEKLKTLKFAEKFRIDFLTEKIGDGISYN